MLSLQQIAVGIKTHLGWKVRKKRGLHSWCQVQSLSSVFCFPEKFPVPGLRGLRTAFGIVLGSQLFIMQCNWLKAKAEQPSSLSADTGPLEWGDSRVCISWPSQLWSLKANLILWLKLSYTLQQRVTNILPWSFCFPECRERAFYQVQERKGDFWILRPIGATSRVSSVHKFSQDWRQVLRGWGKRWQRGQGSEGLFSQVYKSNDSPNFCSVDFIPDYQELQIDYLPIQ